MLGQDQGPTDPAGESPAADGKLDCPDCGRRFARRGLAAHRRQAHGAVTARATPVDAEGPVLAALSRLEAELDRRLARIEAALIERAAPPERRAGPADAVELEELEAVLGEIRAVTDALAALDGPAPLGAPDAFQQGRSARRGALRSELGELRQRQAALLFRLGSAAPGGRFPEGDNPLTFR